MYRRRFQTLHMLIKHNGILIRQGPQALQHLCVPLRCNGDATAIALQRITVKTPGLLGSLQHHHQRCCNLVLFWREAPAACCWSLLALPAVSGSAWRAILLADGFR